MDTPLRVLMFFSLRSLEKVAVKIGNGFARTFMLNDISFSSKTRPDIRYYVCGERGRACQDGACKICLWVVWSCEVGRDNISALNMCGSSKLSVCTVVVVVVVVVVEQSRTTKYLL